MGLARDEPWPVQLFFVWCFLFFLGSIFTVFVFFVGVNKPVRPFTASLPASFPYLSGMGTRKGTWEGENGPLFFLLPMIPCALLPVSRVWRSPLCKKRSA